MNLAFAVRPRRVALLSPCGFGNLGDAAILDSVLQALRRRAPEVEIFGLTLNPRDTESRHGIPAYTLMGRSGAFYPVDDEGARGLPGARPPADPSAPRLRSRLRAQLRRAPRLEAAYLALRGVGDELGHLRRSRALLQGLDTFVVAGGGQIDDYWGGPFGHPYVLWRWARLAPRVGARYLVLSVGTGTLTGRLSRLFVRRAMSHAGYLSFRDEGSRRLAGEAMSVDRAPIVPDLAFAVDLPPGRWAASPGAPVVGVSPMSYRAPRAWPEEDERRYRRYLGSLASCVGGLLGDGIRVALFATDNADHQPIQELTRMVEASVPRAAHALLLRPDVTGVRSLLEVLKGLDAVVASRLHGVLLSHVAGRPCLALSYERKVIAHMTDMDQAAACLGIESFDPRDAVEMLRRLLQTGEAGAALIRKQADQCRSRVEVQYDAVFGKAPGQ